MPSPGCAVVGCSNSVKKLAQWREEICPKHACHQGRDSCICKPPYYMMMFPKADDMKLAWERCVNRIEADNRTVKYGKRLTYYRKGDPWRASPNDRICSVHFADGKPTPSHPLPTLHLGYDFLKVHLPKRNPPATKSLLATRKRGRESTAAAGSTSLYQPVKVDETATPDFSKSPMNCVSLRIVLLH